MYRYNKIKIYYYLDIIYNYKFVLKNFEKIGNVINWNLEIM